MVMSLGITKPAIVYPDYLKSTPGGATAAKYTCSFGYLDSAINAYCSFVHAQFTLIQLVKKQF